MQNPVRMAALIESMAAKDAQLPTRLRNKLVHFLDTKEYCKLILENGLIQRRDDNFVWHALLNVLQDHAIVLQVEQELDAEVLELAKTNANQNHVRLSVRQIIAQAKSRDATCGAMTDDDYLTHLIMCSDMPFPKSFAQVLDNLQPQVAQIQANGEYKALDMQCNAFPYFDSIMTFRYAMAVLNEHLYQFKYKTNYIGKMNDIEVNSPELQALMHELNLTSMFETKMLEEQLFKFKEIAEWKNLYLNATAKNLCHHFENGNILYNKVVSNMHFHSSSATNSGNGKLQEKSKNWNRFLKQSLRQGYTHVDFIAKCHQWFPNVTIQVKKHQSLGDWLYFLRFVGKMRVLDAKSNLLTSMKFWLQWIRDFPGLLQLPKRIIEMSNNELFGMPFEKHIELQNLDGMAAQLLQLDTNAEIAQIDAMLKQNNSKKKPAVQVANNLEMPTRCSINRFVILECE